MIANDGWIRRMALEEEMIDPFSEAFVSEGRISYGLSSYGYDVRLAPHFRIFRPETRPGRHGPAVVDPKAFDEDSFVDREGDSCIVPPGSFVLAETVERFRIPRDVLALCVGKSAYARCGLLVHATPLEPEWEGVTTVSVSNTTPLPAKVYAGEGIAQILFLKADRACLASYADRRGRHGSAAGFTLPSVVV